LIQRVCAAPQDRQSANGSNSTGGEAAVCCTA
jgi:hypothetical protein